MGELSDKAEIGCLQPRREAVSGQHMFMVLSIEFDRGVGRGGGGVVVVTVVVAQYK